MTNVQAGTLMASLVILASKGVRYGTAIDIGCADGTFLLTHRQILGAVPVNIDANALYEPSLREIRDALGGHYLIAAVSDAPGEIELTAGAHPYWSSSVPANDPYWARINGLASGATTVRAVTLDDVARDLNLAPPFLLKLDVQGAEAAALRGAERVLAQTNVVIVEADLDHFQDINRVLVDAGFDLFDAVDLKRIDDHSLGWFYPVYLNRKLKGLLRKSLWQERDNAAVIAKQDERRRSILRLHASLLAEIAKKSG